METFTIGIIGLGLVGGSLGLDFAVWAKKEKIIGYDASEEVAQKAKEKGAVDCLGISAAEVAQESDLIFIATPVRKIPQIFRTIQPFLREGARVFDTGSSKEWIFEEIHPENLDVEYIGFHPMGGAERGGIEGARAGLFRNMPLLIVPGKLRDGTEELLLELGEVIGGKVFF